MLASVTLERSAPQQQLNDVTVARQHPNLMAMSTWWVLC